MHGLSDSAFGRPTGGPPARRPACSCGGLFGRVLTVPAHGALPAVAFRRCAACQHVVFVAPPSAWDGRIDTPLREVAPC